MSVWLSVKLYVTERVVLLEKARMFWTLCCSEKLLVTAQHCAEYASIYLSIFRCICLTRCQQVNITAPLRLVHLKAIKPSSCVHKPLCLLPGVQLRLFHWMLTPWLDDRHNRKSVIAPWIGHLVALAKAKLKERFLKTGTGASHRGGWMRHKRRGPIVIRKHSPLLPRN